MSLTLHLVPHTHWDREWYLTFQQFRIRLVHLVDDLLDLLVNEVAYRHFMLDGQAILLEDYTEIRPEYADEIRRLVRAHRLAVGPWYVLPDEFLVSGESLVRNLMLGDRVSGRFGGRMGVGYVPDTFGHVGQLPQIMQGFGIETAVFRRGLDEEPVELWWQAPDQSRVLVCYLRDGYDNAARLPTADAEAFVAAIRRARDSLAPHVQTGHILLLAGTDHQEPQPELPELIAYANRGRLDGDRLVHSSLPEYVKAVQGNATALPGIKGELRSPRRHHLLPGVLSTRMWIKQRNEAVETLLTRWVEPFSAWAEILAARAAGEEQRNARRTQPHLTGHEPLGRVRRSMALVWRAWRFLLENQPHDSIAGCSVDQVHGEMVARFDQAEQIGQELARQSLVAVAQQIDTESWAQGQDLAGAEPLVVFNPTGARRTDVVSARLSGPGSGADVEIVTPDGRRLPGQAGRTSRGEERELFHLTLAPEELQLYTDLIQEGRLLNHAIQQVELRCTGTKAYLWLGMVEGGEPDHARLAAVRAEVDRLVAEKVVAQFVVRATVVEPREFLFVAPELPPHGYATFLVRRRQTEPSQQAPTAPVRQEIGEDVLENDLFQLQVDAISGTWTLTDKTNGAVYPGLNRFVDGGDRGDTYNYCPPEADEIVDRPAAPPQVEILAKGPVRQALEITQVYRLPVGLGEGQSRRADETVEVPIVSRVYLYRGVPRVDVETRVSNVARDHRLRVHFPVPVAVDYAHTEAHFYVARRTIPTVPPSLDTGDWVEQPASTVPQRGWADVSDGQVGLLVANRGLPEVEFIPGEGQVTMALTLLRCVGWLSRGDLRCRQGHAGPELATPEAQCSGDHVFHYALVPHSGGWQAARDQAESFRAPLRAVVTGRHTGSLPLEASLVEVEPASFVLTAIKQPEGRNHAGLLVRGVNLSDQPVTLRLRPRYRFDRIARVNLNEDFVEPLLAQPDGSVTLAARPWEIVSVRWED